MNAQDRVVDLLQQEFTRLQTRNPGFSLRAFARRLDLAPSLLSEILRGKSRVTRKTGEKVLMHIGQGPDQIQHLISELRPRIDRARAREKSNPVRHYSTLNMDQFHLISEWEHFAVFSLAATAGFAGEPMAIGKTLGIPTRKARTVLERLLAMGLLSRSVDGHVTATCPDIRTTSDIPNIYIRRAHLENLELARRSMNEDALDETDYSVLTLAIDPDKIPEAKKRIREFRLSLGQFLESGVRRRVARLSIQFFPLSNRKKVPRKSRKEDNHVD